MSNLRQDSSHIFNANAKLRESIIITYRKINMPYWQFFSCCCRKLSYLVATCWWKKKKRKKEKKRKPPCVKLSYLIAIWWLKEERNKRKENPPALINIFTIIFHLNRWKYHPLTSHLPNCRLLLSLMKMHHLLQPKFYPDTPNIGNLTNHMVDIKFSNPDSP